MDETTHCRLDEYQKLRRLADIAEIVAERDPGPMDNEQRVKLLGSIYRATSHALVTSTHMGACGSCTECTADADWLHVLRGEENTTGVPEGSWTVQHRNRDSASTTVSVLNCSVCGRHLLNGPTILDVPFPG